MRIALCQMSSGENVADNVRVAGELLASAADAGADLAALPEVFAARGSLSRVRESAEPVPGPTSERLAEAARRHHLWVLAGSMAELEGEHVYNTSLLFDRSGEQIARYRKIHLFDVEALGEQPSIRESTAYAPGAELVTAETEFGRVGLSICYDLRFPELYRGLMARGAEVLFVPANFTQRTGEAHWEVLLRARAIENQAFVVAPAQWGTWGAAGRHRSYGNSLVADPWGRVLARAPGAGTQVVAAELDFEELRRVRKQLPALQHRRLGPVC